MSYRSYILFYYSPSNAEDRCASAIPTAQDAASVFIAAGALALGQDPEVAQHWPSFSTEVSINIQPPTSGNNHGHHAIKQGNVKVVQFPAINEDSGVAE